MISAVPAENYLPHPQTHSLCVTAAFPHRRPLTCGEWGLLLSPVSCPPGRLASFFFTIRPGGALIEVRKRLNMRLFPAFARDSNVNIRFVIRGSDDD